MVRSQPSGAIVLLAEDNESNIETFTGYLAAARHQIVVVRDGGEVLERALETHPDIIVMDIHLPGLDGIEAIRSIRAEETLRNVPIIAVTALSMPGDSDQCTERRGQCLPQQTYQPGRVNPRRQRGIGKTLIVVELRPFQENNCSKTNFVPIAAPSRNAIHTGNELELFP